MKLSEKKKIALVLSGGGIKAAAFHIGVCLALKEKGFRFAGGTKEEVAAHTRMNLSRFDLSAPAGSVISTFLAAVFLSTRSSRPSNEVRVSSAMN